MNLSDEIPWLGTASRRKRWLVGVSGGADSVALLHLLVHSGFKKLVVCHLDHQLRADDSTLDARFVRDLAEGLGLPHEIGTTDVAGLMKSTGQKSLETAARHARHTFFSQCAARHRCDRILLAHHADDQAETMLWNLLRGSRGLKGMEETQLIQLADRSQIEIHRPLLTVRRQSLVSWLLENHLSWREDVTNGQPIAVRNRLRNEALPLLAEISGRDPAAAILRAASDQADIAAVEDWALEKANVLDPQGRLHLPALRALPQPLQRTAIRRYLQSHAVPDLERGLLDRCATLITSMESAVVNLPGGRYLKRRAGRLLVTE